MAKQPQTHQDYLTSVVESASQLQLIVMLHDGVIRFLQQGKDCLLRNDIGEASERLLKAKAIVTHLLSSLQEDKGGVIAKVLRQLHLFCFEQITDANLKKDPAPLDGVINVFSVLRGGWHELSNRSSQAEQASADMQAEDSDSLYLSVTT